ncbi:MAG: transketolase family protein [Lachnospiraceae bacterium]|nr:transketolase family protein [Lachnospiraceae bacterium]
MNKEKSFLRNVIGEYMTTLGEKNENVVIVNADLAGTCRNTSFVEKYPDRAFNVGIAEQNMVSFAAGLSVEGFIPYAFSMAPFLTMRALEQCRTDVAYGNRNVKLMGVYAGVTGGISGATHWAVEDCGIMTSVPGMSVFEVSDAILARKLMDYTLEKEGPTYIRIGVEPTENIYNEDISVCTGGSVLAKDGEDGMILCSGVVVQYALEAAKRLRENYGKQIGVVDMYSIKPIDETAIEKAAATGHILVAQDHVEHGGLGMQVANVLVKKGLQTRFSYVGLPDRFVPMAHAPYLYHEFHLDGEGLAAEMLKLWE